MSISLLILSFLLIFILFLIITQIYKPFFNGLFGLFSVLKWKFWVLILNPYLRGKSYPQVKLKG
ncbi:hypothetical protein EU792_03455 [Campylobacter upsaliensis]|nr:hypothetical protein [Campylobacter upsaliensis]EAL3908401.1 hypothetical protein [Campylobacter upsaliensis]